MRIAIINGPNLNLLGKREPGIYGDRGFDGFLAELRARHPDVDIAYHQSNLEGEIVDALQREGFQADGIILNPGGYTHTSVAIGDAVAAVPAPVVEVHISNVHAREAFRRISHVSAKCRGTIAGLGLEGYELALRFLSLPGSASR
jgi:3-dehydroquinate dehydratase-2